MGKQTKIDFTVDTQLTDEQVSNLEDHFNPCSIERTEVEGEREDVLIICESTDTEPPPNLTWIENALTFFLGQEGTNWELHVIEYL